jgi:uncharacterized protein YjbJ (UPF0337 family)
MNSDVLKGKWKQLSGSAKAKWSELTDVDLDAISGEADKLTGKLQEKYGYTKAEARRQVDDWFREHDLG